MGVPLSRRLARFFGGQPRCPSCGATLARREARFPLAEADAIATALDLADPDRLARVPAPAADAETLELVVLACPACGTGRLRMQAELSGRRVRIGPVYDLFPPFLADVLAALSPPGAGR